MRLSLSLASRNAAVVFSDVMMWRGLLGLDNSAAAQSTHVIAACTNAHIGRRRIICAMPKGTPKRRRRENSSILWMRACLQYMQDGWACACIISIIMRI